MFQPNAVAGTASPCAACPASAPVGALLWHAWRLSAPAGSNTETGLRWHALLQALWLPRLPPALAAVLRAQAVAYRAGGGSTGRDAARPLHLPTLYCALACTNLLRNPWLCLEEQLAARRSGGGDAHGRGKPPWLAVGGGHRWSWGPAAEEGLRRGPGVPLLPPPPLPPYQQRVRGCCREQRLLLLLGGAAKARLPLRCRCPLTGPRQTPAACRARAAAGRCGAKLGHAAQLAVPGSGGRLGGGAGGAGAVPAGGLRLPGCLAAFSVRGGWGRGRGEGFQEAYQQKQRRQRRFQRWAAALWQALHSCAA